ncbi:leuS [Wigglesworthia glossinidia endosymbiont of Glossina brevipalpis]|uniref:Leucine--tRNA ligase n=1 Tax=Wigglesworthia glossinidia brevipalpis TaxID=36870 RepID=SYL_WIGBR|nr:RecName: Full=Leucine--tRNA ligase; AltName: Full=Leucyl-tRNA synthetase; Short=LeuRS [Wigglesworthia glossinidia endosymbiont of Glossina brevipalpis]BAC24314.1 leuS [Wigglesworthia glossinidia endosymbiont of Glossina brevipalpis]
MKKEYSCKEIERFVQKHWEINDTFKVLEDSKKDKYYCVSMMPYPSGKLHMGHVRNYVLGDVIARYQRMLGKNVLHPIGWDAFGLPAETAAINNKISPEKWTISSIEYMKNQLKLLGCSYDWSREIITCDPKYYKWEQLLFTKLYNKNKAYKKKSIVNWCPKDKTVLANEQVIDNLCWRCSSNIEMKKIFQWFIKITDYADELLNDLNDLKLWPKKVKVMQRNWIGKSKGIDVLFHIKDTNEKILIYVSKLEIFMGITFIVISKEHKLIKFIENKLPSIAKLIKNYNNEKTLELNLRKKTKDGIFTSLFAIHPISKKILPIWISNFFFTNNDIYQSIAAIPAYNKNELDFAKKYNLPIRYVIKDYFEKIIDFKKYNNLKEGILFNSNIFNGLNLKNGYDRISKFLISNKIGKRSTHYKLRDWCISRQRYWGAPIPVLITKENKILVVSENELPVILPKAKNNNIIHSLNSYKDWIYVLNDNKLVKREVDTFDTFMESSWYLHRYTCTKYTKDILDPNATNYWFPVDQYIGGIEHATMHLLYLRFYHKILRDMNFVKCDEPVNRLLCQGMVLSDTFYYFSKSGNKIWTSPKNKNFERNKDNKIINAIDSLGNKLTHIGMSKMSKSKNNGVDPQGIINKYGSDTLRLFIMFAAPPELSLEWSDKGIIGANRFIKKLWKITYNYLNLKKNNNYVFYKKLKEQDNILLEKSFYVINKVTKDIDKNQTFNTAIAEIMKLTNHLNSYINKNEYNNISIIKKVLMIIIRLLYPFIPHVCFVLWNEINKNNDIDKTKWPKIKMPFIKNKKKNIVVQINGKLKTVISFDISCNEFLIKKCVIENNKIKNLLNKKKIKNIIYVKNKIINIVLDDK